MIEDIIFSAQTGDSFNPVIILAIASATLLALIFLLFSMKGKK